MELVKIKPLSVNECWEGRRTKTDKYRAYEIELMFVLLPKMMFIPEGKLQIHLEFGFSSRGSDFDNPVKLFIDILQKKYGFNDNIIYRAIIDKKIVKKGEEYIKFEITKFHEQKNRYI